MWEQILGTLISLVIWQVVLQWRRLLDYAKSRVNIFKKQTLMIYVQQVSECPEGTSKNFTWGIRDVLIHMWRKNGVQKLSKFGNLEREAEKRTWKKQGCDTCWPNP